MKKTVLIIGFILSLGLCFLLGKYISNKNQQIRNQEEEKKLIQDIQKHYNQSVETIKNTPLYKKEGNKLKKIGLISKNTSLSLEEISFHTKEKYFQIKDTKNYIYYKNVKKTTLLKKTNQRFQHYLYFDESLKTKNTFSLYQEGKKIYTFYEVMEFKILIKEENYYGVVYQDDLYYLKKEDVSNTYLENNNEEEKAIEIPVTVYHFLYLENESCNEIICNSINQVEEEFTYLKENHYFTLNTKEMEQFVKEEINLPKRSILITIDDGAKATNFLSVLAKYQMNATLFLVSSWYFKEDFQSDYLELASHTHNLHTPGVCSGGQGSPLKCMEKQELLTDLKLSRETLDATDAFCFPFYEYNAYAIEVVKEAGFKSAYIGTNKKAKVGENPYTIPRITIHNSTSISEYIHLIQ